MAIVNTSNLLSIPCSIQSFQFLSPRALRMASSSWEMLLGCSLVIRCPSAFNDQMEPRVFAVLRRCIAELSPRHLCYTDLTD